MGRKTCIGLRFLFHRQLWSVAMMAESTVTGCTAKKCSCEWHSAHTFQSTSVFTDYIVWYIFQGVGQCLADSAHQLAWLCHTVGHRHTPMQDNKKETYVNGICAPHPKQSSEFLFQTFNFSLLEQTDSSC